MVVVEKLCSSNSITLGIRSRAPSSESRSAHPPPHSSTSVRSTGIRSRAPTATPRGGRPLPRSYTSTLPTGSRPPATPSTLRDFHPSPLTKVFLTRQVTSPVQALHRA